MSERKIFSRSDKHLPQSKELGFGQTDARQRRVINPDGSYNWIRTGLPFYETFNVYHWLITLSWTRFFATVFVWYSFINLIFVGLYYAACPDGLAGMNYTNEKDRFWEIYFFSAQTLTTVGYGRLNPASFSASAISSLEALVGLLSFALITGLLFARFAKSPAKLLFSKNAVFAPFTWNGNPITGLMFRTINPYETNLMNLKAQITCSILEFDAAGNSTRKFYPLSLERDIITFFPSSWTVVHPIDDSSPFYGLDWEGVKRAMPELLILLNGFDETFDQNVFVRYSYSTEEMIWGAKFTRISTFAEEGVPSVDIGKLDDFEKIPIDDLIPVLQT
jgi:inward rectifier potassium channel